jgi:hypothetical protein
MRPDLWEVDSQITYVSVFKNPHAVQNAVSAQDLGPSTSEETTSNHYAKLIPEPLFREFTGENVGQST